MKYNTEVLSFGQDHPEVIALRRDIDARVKAGEKCDREKLAAMLENFRQQYRSLQKEVGGSHPSGATVVSYIVLLSELLAIETEDSSKLLEAIAKVKDNWVTGVLYVPGGRFIGYGAKREDTEIEISSGSDDGLKVGMHLYVYAKQDDLVTGVTPLGKSFVMGQVASVEPRRAKVKLLSSLPNNPLPTKIFCTQPGFNIGSLVITVRFDDEAWENRPLMNAFLGDLLHNCSGEERAKLNILVTDTPRSDCQIDLLPIGPKGHTEEQLRTLKALDSYVKEQPYFTNVKLNSVTSFEDATHPAAKAEDSPRSYSFGQLYQGLRQFQLRELKGTKPEDLPDWIDHLRKNAEETEKASIAKANEVREAIAAKPPKSAEELEQLKADLRKAVDEAFIARDRLQWMEFTALTIQVQKTLSSLGERSSSKGRKAIVDRRVDDLLNPNYRWESNSKMLPAGEPEFGLQARMKRPIFSSVTGLVTVRGQPITGRIGFGQPGSSPTLEPIDQTGKFQFDELQPGKYKVSVFADSESAAKYIRSEYKDPLTTTIEVEVVFGEKNEFQFEFGK